RSGDRIGRRKEQPREDEDGCGGIDVEVEELDSGADETCKQHLSGAVHDSIDAGGKLLGHGALGISALLLSARPRSAAAVAMLAPSASANAFASCTALAE